MTAAVIPETPPLSAANTPDESKLSPPTFNPPQHPTTQHPVRSSSPTPHPQSSTLPAANKRSSARSMGAPSKNDGSDADTCEPVQAVNTTDVVVEESDGEQFVNSKSQESADGKMRAIIARINEDSDRSDGEPSGADDDVDFGDQVEDDPQRPGKRARRLSHKEDDGDASNGGEKHKTNGQEGGAIEDEEADDIDHTDSVRETGVGEKATKLKKTKKDAVVKTIKKQTEQKAKTKAVKGKSAAATKRKDSEKAKAKQASSTDPSAKDSPKASPKKASPKPKKTAPKTAAKGANKAEGKSRVKAAVNSSVEEVKDSKPKKTIVKQEKSTKKPLAKNAVQLKTFSKKMAATPAKGASVAKKGATKVKTEKKAQAKPEKKAKKTRGKSRPMSKSSEDEEEADVMVVDSDAEEAPSADESADEMEEVAKTPGKHSNLGNLTCSSRDSTCTALLDHAVQQLGKYNVISYGADSDNELSAYVIGKDTKRGWGILQALASGVPLVSDDWLSNSISEGKWKPMDMYRSDKFGQSPRSVDATAVPTYKIFDGQRVKVISQEKDVASMRKLLKSCGARVAETRMDVIINDTGKPVDGCVNVTRKWLADSVEAGMVLEYDAYIVGA